MTAGDNQARSIAHLRSAVRALDDPPATPSWNVAELADLADDTMPRRDAAVLVPFVRRDGALSILFTQRAQTLRHHAGQISFPGGAVEAVDADVVAAALRETEEETGISGAQIEPFGYLDRLDTVSGFRVTPVAGFVAGDYTPSLSSEEVDEVFEVPLAFVLDPASLRRERLLWRGRERTIFAFEWQQRRIWGATAAILKNLLDRLEGVA